MKIIPFNSSLSSRQELSINISEKVIKLFFCWNIRESAWFVDFRDSDDECKSVILKEGYNLIPENRLKINGNFRVIKLKNTDENEITFENFGKSYFLVYGTKEEWSDWDGV